MKYRIYNIIFIILLFIIIAISALFSYKEPFSDTHHKHTLALLCICKNESMVIDEFIRHYRWQGVEHIYLIDNGSSDNMKSVIDKYIDTGYVCYFYLPEQHKQVENYMIVYNEIRNQTKWLIVCDVDEYIYNRNPKQSILTFIQKTPDDVCEIQLRWKMFGSNGLDSQPSSIRTSFLQRKKDSENTIKCIVNTKLVNKLDVHSHNDNPSLKSIYQPDELELNHYAIMSKEYFTKVKMTRGDVANGDLNTFRDMSYFKKYDHNEVIDDELHNLVKADNQ